MVPILWEHGALATKQMLMDPTNQFLTQYVTQRLPELKPGVFEGAEDIPHFTVDQRYIPPGGQTVSSC